MYLIAELTLFLHLFLQQTIKKIMFVQRQDYVIINHIFCNEIYWLITTVTTTDARKKRTRRKLINGDTVTTVCYDFGVGNAKQSQ